MNGRRILPALVIAVTLGVGIVIGTLVSHGVRAARGMNAAAADAAPLPAPSPADLSNSFSRVADMVEPAVVNINTETVVRVGRRRFHGLLGELLCPASGRRYMDRGRANLE